MRHGRVDPLDERLDGRPDSDLVARASAGEASSFEELYRRYAAAAWRVAYAVAGNPDDAADAVSDAFTRVFEVLPGGRLAEGEFGPYLLASARNAAIDTLRRSGRLEPTDQMDSLDQPTLGPSPFDRVVQGEDSSIVARAFRSLPERWRSVLWMTEVEGIPPREVGARMGLTANTAAQLATRARAGLRERYLQAHLSERVEEDCRFAVERLGAYVAGRLAPRDLAKVDQHVTACAACRARTDELNDVGATLRRLSLPLPILLGHQVFARWRTAASTGATSSARAGAFSPAAIPETLLRFQKPLLAVSSGLFALGVISASVVGSPGAPFGEARRVIERVPRDTGPLVVEDPAGGPELAAAPTEALDVGLDIGLGDGPEDAGPPPPAGPREQPRGTGTAPPRPEPLAGVPTVPVGDPIATTGLAVDAGPLDLGASAGVDALSSEAPCVGATVEPGPTLGCPPPPPPEPDVPRVVIITIGGSGVGVVDQPAITVVSPI